MLKRLNKRLALSSFLGLGALATVSLAVAVAAYIQRLPAPEETDQRGLFRWLVRSRPGPTAA